MILMVILFPSFSFSSDIHFFNTDILGQPTSAQINLLDISGDNERSPIEPKIIQLDNDDGHFVASSVYYDVDKIDLIRLVENIDQKYPNSKIEKLSSKTYARWRVENRKFVIYLSSEKEEDMFRVIYLKFRSTEKVMENITNTLKFMDKKCSQNKK